MKLALTIAALVLAARPALADDDLKHGLALYKEGKYAEAVAVLAKAYAADPKPEVLFPLAQAERLSGDCKSAALHYKKILEQVGDLNVAKLVRQNLELCEPPKPEQPAQPAPPPVCETKPAEPPPPAPPPPPPPAKVVVRDVNHTDQLAVISAGGGALALGVATGLYFAMSSTKDAAGQANSLAAHNELSDRADSERTAMIVSASIGAAAIGFAVFRLATHPDAPAKTDVVVVPTAHGGAAAFTLRW